MDLSRKLLSQRTSSYGYGWGLVKVRVSFRVGGNQANVPQLGLGFGLGLVLGLGDNFIPGQLS